MSALLAPFAERGARANAAVLRHLSNAVATLPGGGEVAGMFDDPYARGGVGSVGMAATQPEFIAATGALPADVVGIVVTIQGQAYVVVEHQPDGVGLSRLVLEMSS